MKECTGSRSKAFKGFDFGVEVKMGCLFSKRLGEMEQSVGAGGLGEENATGSRETVLDGRIVG